MEHKLDLSICIPADLEEENLRILLPRIKQAAQLLQVNFEILVIDVMVSMDNTELVCKEFDVKYINREIGNKYGDAIRTAIKENTDVTNYTPMKNLDKYPSPNWDDYYGYIRNLLLTTPKKQLQEIFLMDEGIENHLYKCAYKCYNFEQFINKSVTRRYTRSRIQRTLCHLLVHITKKDIEDIVEYDTLRPLAFSQKGQEYLKLLQQQGVKIANHFTANIKQYRDIEFKAAIAYSMNMDENMKKYLTRSEISGLNYKK